MNKSKEAKFPKYAKWVVVQKDWEGRVIGTFFYDYKRYASRLADALMCELNTGIIDVLPIKEWRDENDIRRID